MQEYGILRQQHKNTVLWVVVFLQMLGSLCGQSSENDYIQKALASGDVDSLMQILQNKQVASDLRGEAASFLAKKGPPQSLVAIYQIIRDTKEDIVLREICLSVVGKIANKESIYLLFELLEDTTVVSFVAEAIGEAVKQHIELFPLLRGKYDSSPKQIQLELLAYALGRIGHKHPRIITDLQIMAEATTDPEMLLATLKVIGTTMEDNRILPCLIRLLQSQYQPVRQSVAFLIAELDNQEKAIVPVLLEAAAISDEVTQMKAVWLLSNMKTQPDVLQASSVVKEVLRKPGTSNPLKIRFATYLYRLDMTNDYTIPFLLQLAKKKQYSETECALVIALGIIGELSPQLTPQILPLVITYLNSNDLQVRIAAITAVGLLKPKNDELLNLLKNEFLSSNHPQEVIAAADTIWKVTKCSQELLPCLLRVWGQSRYESDDFFTAFLDRYRIYILFTKIGETAQQFIKQHKDNTWMVRKIRKDIAYIEENSYFFKRTTLVYYKTVLGWLESD